jgi:hypothetical protein
MVERFALRRLAVLLCLLAGLALPQTVPPSVFPLKDLRAGMKGVGKTVFAGMTVSDFGVEILGVLENVGPRQSIILGRLSGGPLDKTGVMQGMSGSPVYIDGKLVGAVAMSFPFSKEPIAGIRPIGEMLAGMTTTRAPQYRARLSDRSLLEHAPKRDQGSEDRPDDIATPVSFTGFTANTIAQFGAQLKAIGLEPRQGISGGRSPRPVKPAVLQPGSMISVQLARGDMAVGADGTVTHVDGRRVYAFGHRFLSAGATELPFSAASVLTLLPNLSSSFKISAAGEWLGSVTADYNAAVAGELGRKAKMATVNVAVVGAERDSKYRIEIVQERLLSPLLLQMILYSALDATERTLGASSVRVKGAVKFEGVPESVAIDNMYAGDFNVPLVASLGTALPVAYALQNTLDPLRVESIDLAVETSLEKKQVAIEQVWTSKREVRPGEGFDVSVLMLGEGGREVVRKVRYEVPIGAKAGPMNISVADGPSTNAGDQRVYTLMQPRPAPQVISLLNSLRGSTKGFIRIWRGDAAYTLDGRDLPQPPPSVGMILARIPGAAASQGRTTTLAEMSFDAGDAVITGAKTIQVEVKE